MKQQPQSKYDQLLPATASESKRSLREKKRVKRKERKERCFAVLDGIVAMSDTGWPDGRTGYMMNRLEKEKDRRGNMDVAQWVNILCTYGFSRGELRAAVKNARRGG